MAWHIAWTNMCEKTKTKTTSRNHIERKKCESHFVTMHSTCVPKPRKSVAPNHLMLFFAIVCVLCFFLLRSIRLPTSIYRHNNALQLYLWEHRIASTTLYWMHCTHTIYLPSHKVIGIDGNFAIEAPLLFCMSLDLVIWLLVFCL